MQARLRRNRCAAVRQRQRQPADGALRTPGIAQVRLMRLSVAIAGIVRATLRERLGERRTEADFDIDQLLDDDDAWQGFMNEIFGHALRIAPEGSAAG